MSNVRADAPGLNLARLRQLRHQTATSGRLPLILSRIQDHLENSDGYLAFSGGKDSLAVLHLTLQVDHAVPVVFFDSGFEYPETYAYLQQIQSHYDITIDVIPSRRTTLQVLIDSGAWDHDTPPGRLNENLHRLLITEPASIAHQRYGPGELWGVRAEESQGRRIRYALALREEMAAQCGPDCCAGHLEQRHTHGGLIRRQDTTLAYGPVWDWSTEQIWAYLDSHHVPVNPIYQRLRALGAPEHFHRISTILDGQRLEHGRCTWLQRGWPTLFNALATALPRIREFV